MIIHTANYELRTFEKGDVDEFYELAHDDAIEKYVPYVYCKKRRDAEIAIRDYMKGDCRNDFYLGIVKNNIIVGCIIAVRTKNFILDVLVCVKEEERGKGIMLEALNGFILWLKNYTEYQKLQMAINMYNDSSLRLFDKIGAELYRQKNNNYYYQIILK